ncbi:MAG: EF-hand domain-containing protein [Phycisphaerales bacterium]|nr:EF-hand domain-containing protein [Phycisphaerales bacterium]
MPLANRSCTGRALALSTLCTFAGLAAAQPQLHRIDPSNVKISGHNGLRLVGSVDYSNTMAPLFVPPVGLPELNFAGDDLTLASAGTACGIDDFVSEVSFGIRFDASWGGSATADLYVLFFDDVYPGAASPPVFDNFLGGFFLSGAATLSNADAFYTVSDLVDNGIFIPVPDPSIGVIVIASQSGSSGFPILPAAGASVLAAGSTPNAGGGSGPDIGNSSSTIWCDTTLDMDIEGAEGYPFASPTLGNLYLQLKLARACPACTNPAITYTYLVSGNASGASWSWRIESQTGEFQPVEDLSAPGSTVSTLAVAQNFAASINNMTLNVGCMNNQFIAAATPLANGDALLAISVTGTDPINLLVGAANTAPGCLVTTLPACSFNPSIQEVVLSSQDCNENGQDDAIDIAQGTSADLNNNGVPDECCKADFNQSGFVDLEDYSDFVEAFEAGTDDADFDESGFVDLEDFHDFVVAFEAGC